MPTENLSVRISTMFSDRGIKDALKGVKGLSSEIESVGDRAGRSASRTRTSFASISKAMRDVRAEAKTGASFKVSANVSALAGVKRTFSSLRQDAQRGATFEVRGDASGLRDVQGTFSSIRRDAANGAVFRTRLDQQGLSGVSSSFSRIRQDAANGATFRVKSDQQGLAGIGGALSAIRQDASNGAAFRVRGVMSGISGIPGVLSTIRQDAANGATFRVHAAATGLSQVMGALGMLDQRASMMDQKWGRSVHIHTDATNVDGVMAELSRLGIEATRLDNDEIDIPVDADSENARRQLEQIRLVAQSLSGQDARIRVDADAAAARVRLAEIERQMSDLDGQTARVGVTTFGASGVSELAGKIRALTTVLAVASTPALISMLAAVPAVASAAAAGIGALAVGIGGGLVGGAMAGAGAMGVLAASFGLVGGPISALVDKLTKYHSGLKSSGAASQAASSAAQQYGDASRAVDQAVAKRGQTEEDVAQSVGDAWQSYQRQQEQTGQTAQQVAQETADAWQGYQDTIADTGRTTQQVAQANADAWDQYVSTREKTGQVEEQVAQASADAAKQLEGARTDLMAATASVVREQREYNQALSDEPRNQAYSALDLADARDRLSDSTRQYNQDVAEYGANSEQATDSLRAMQRAELDLQKQQQTTTDVQKNGSEELRGAFGELVNAQTERGQAALRVADAEENADRVAREGAQQMAEARKAESDQYQTFLRTQEQGAQQIQDAKKAEAQAYEAYRRTEAQGAQQMEAARQAEADQYQAYQRAKAQGDRQLQESQDAVNRAVEAASRAAEAMGAAQEKAAGGAVVLTAAQQALYDRFMAFKADAGSAFAPAMDSAALLGVRVLDLADNYLPALGAASYAAMGELGRAFDGFAAKLQQPIPAGAIQTILDYVPEATYLAATAAGDLGLALVTALSIAAPYGMDLLRIVGGLISTFSGWVTSAEGVSTVESAFAGLWTRAGQLWGIVSDLGAGLYGLGVALESSGLVDMATGALAMMAQNFRDATSSSSGLSGNMERLKPVLQAAAGLAGTLWTEFWKVADAVLAATNPDTGNSTLLELMDSLKDVVPLIGDTLITTFEELAPAISRNIRPISEFVSNFIGSTDTLVGVVDSLGYMADKFNNLSPAAKDAAAEMASVAGVAALLGIDGGSLAATAFYTSGAALNLWKLGAAAGPAAVALWGYASAAASALIPFAGLAALGLVAIGVALTFDWGGAADAYSKAREDGDGVGIAFGEALDAGLRTVPVLGWVWEKFNEFDAKLKGDWSGIVADWAFSAFGFEPPKISLLDALGNQLAKLLPGGEWDGIFSAWFDRTWAALKPPETSVLDVLMGNGDASENPLLSSLTTAWEGVTGWLGGLVPEVNLMGILLGGTGEEENPLLSKLTAAWTGVTEWLGGLVPEVNLMGVLLGGAGEENPLLTKLTTAWAGVTEWLASLVPEISLMDVLMGAAAGVDNWLLTPLVTAWAGVTEWLAGLVPEVNLMGVLLGGAGEENPLLSRLTSAWAGVTEWLASLVPEVSITSLLMGQGEAGANPILTTVMGWWTGLTAWLTPTLATLGTLFMTGWTAVSTVTTTALTGVSTFISSWWSILSGYFTIGLQAVGAVVMAGWTFVSTTTSTVFSGIAAFVSAWWTTLSGYFAMGLQIVGAAVASGWQFVSSTTFSVFGAVMAFLAGWWASGKALFFSGLEAVKGAVGTGWQWVSSTTSSVYGAVGGFLSGWWSGTKGLFASSLEAVESGVGAGWNWVSSTTSSVFEAIGSFFGGWWSGTISFFASSVDAVKSGVGAGWDWLSGKTTSAYTGIRDTVVSLFTHAKDKALSIAGSLKDGAVRVFEGLRDSAKGIFETVADNIWKPVEFAEGKLKEVWNRIIDGVASVLEAIGDPGGLAGKLQGAKFASAGAVTTGMASGGTTSYMAEGGITHMARGGLGTSGPNDHHVVWNEQMGNEAWIAERGPREKSVGYLREAAGWHGMDVVPKGMRSDRPSRGKASRPHGDRGERGHGKVRMKEGGLGPVDLYAFHGATAYEDLWSPATAKIARDVQNATGAAPNTYTTHPDGYEYRAPYSIDWWGAGGRGDPIGTGLGDQVLDYVLGKYSAQTSYWIWNGNDAIGGSIAATDPHYDHVHWTSNEMGEDLTGQGGGSGGGGGGIRNWIREKAEGLWDSTVGNLYKDLDFGPHVLAKGAASLVEQSGESIKKWVFDSLPLGGGGSGPGDPGGPEELRSWAKRGLTLGNAWGPVTESMIDATVQQAMIESAGDPNAVNNWDINAINGTPSKGLVQAIEPTWESVRTMYGQDLGPFASNWNDPVKSVAAGSRSMKSQWGEWVWPTSGGYDLGGVIPGMDGEKVLIQAHAGERVLPRSLVSSFDRLAESITLWSNRSAGGGGAAPGDGGAQETNQRIVEELGEIKKVLRESGIKVKDLDRPAADKVGAGLEGRIRRYAGSSEFGDAVQGHRSRYERGVRVGGGF